MNKKIQIPQVPENIMVELKQAQKALLARIKKDQENKSKKDQ
jgi:hypothetical protein